MLTTRSAWMARTIAGQAHDSAASVWLLRYRERGWNGGVDRITSFAETSRYVERAKGIATAVQLVDMGALGHYMLTDVETWNTVARTSSLTMLKVSRRASG